MLISFHFGPPKSFTVASPEPNIFKLIKIIPKLSFVLDQPVPMASPKVISAYNISGYIPITPIESSPSILVVVIISKLNFSPSLSTMRSSSESGLALI